MARIDIHVPDLGDFEDVPVIEIAVAVGDTVAVEQLLITLESDKATLEVPSTHAGVMVALALTVGDQVSQGHLIGTLEVAKGTGEPTADALAPSPVTPLPPPSQADEDGAPPPVQTDHLRIQAPVGTDGATVSELTAAVGNAVTAGEVLMALQQAGRATTVTAPQSGVISEVLVHIDDHVNAGQTVIIIDLANNDLAIGPRAIDLGPNNLEPTHLASVGSESIAPGPIAPGLNDPGLNDPGPTAPTPQSPPSGPRRPSPTANLSRNEAPRSAHATPAIRCFARELGVNLTQVRGTGRKGRVLREDIKEFVKERLKQPVASPSTSAGGAGIPPIPEVDFAKFGPIEVQPLSRIQRVSGPHLHRAWLNIPHVTHHDEADVTDLEVFRQALKDDAKARGVRVTMLAFITKAMTVALRQFPAFNASLSGDGQQLILKRYYHIGIAVDTPTGLVVPVLKDVDEMGVYDIAARMGEISARARDSKLTPEDMRGGCISISSLGGIGGTAFSPVINAPEVAILGVSKARMQPVWNGSKFKPRLMLPLDLSYDHRVIDGAAAARFTAYLAQLLGDVRRLLL